MPTVAKRGTQTARPCARLYGATALSTLVGLALLASPAQAANFNVASDSDLRNAISNASDGDSITFTGNITLTSNLPIFSKNLTIDGGNHSLSGGDQYRGLFVQSGTVSVQNLTISHTVALGGKGGDGHGGGGGGGGAGLGGAIFVGAGAHVTVGNVQLVDNLARGGGGGNSWGGDTWTSGGGGGFFPTGADGGHSNVFASGGGGTGGGGDGADNNPGGNGGFGGGGGGSGQWTGGTGGFGGGGGGGVDKTTAAGGFLGGASGRGGTGTEPDGSATKYGGGGGGGAGLGGAIFVESGGSLAMFGSITTSGNLSHAGVGGSTDLHVTEPFEPLGQAGKAAGAGLFLAGNGTLSLAPAGGEAFRFADAISDQTGSGGTGANAGRWALEMNGAGFLYLTGANSYSGGTTVNSGYLVGNSAGIQGNVLNNALVLFDQKTDGTYAGVMSGTGALQKQGSGTLTLAGAIQIAGGILVEGGNLLFASEDYLLQSGTAVRLSGGGIGFATTKGQVAQRDLTLAGTGGLHVGVNEQDPNAQLTWNGAIGGDGALIVSGGGTLELTGANSYTGGTRIEGSHLRFTTDQNLGAAGGGVLLDKGSIATTNDAVDGLSIQRTLFLAGDGSISVGLRPLVWSGDISGSGGLVKEGDGVLQLTGSNSYTGGTFVYRGVLEIASDDKLGAAGTVVTMGTNGLIRASESFTMNRPVELIAGGGGFLLDSGTTLTLAGTLEGSGPLSLIGTGTLVLDLAATPNYGGINNYGGTIQGNSLNLIGDIAFDTNAQNANARAILFDQVSDGIFAGNIAGIGGIVGLGSITKIGAGKLTLSGISNYRSQVAGLAEVTVAEGTLQGTSNSLQGAIHNNATLIFDQDFDGTYAGSMSGTGTLTKNGTGRLNLTGASSVGGGTTINAGGLAVNGPLTSNIVLNAGGTLSGVGNITGDIINNGGTIKPGNSIGHLVFNGNYTHNSGTLTMEINAAGDSDRISVIGAGHRVMINAGTLEIIAEPGIYTPNTRYTIITTQGGGTVNFDEVSGGVGFLKPKVSLDPNNIYVTLALAPDAFRAAGETRNQQAVGAALDALAAAGQVGGIVTTMANLDVTDGATALQALSGEPYANFSTVNLRASQLFTNAVSRQMSVARSGSTEGNRAALAAPGSDALTGVSVWISGIGSRGSLDGDDNAAGLDYSLGGTAFGVDYRLSSGLLLGVAGTYISGSQSVDGFTGDTDAETLGIVAYGSFGQGALHVDALAGYANARNELHRDVAGAGLPGRTAMVDSRADQFLGQIEIGYRLGLGASAKASVTPFGSFQMLSTSQDGFTETGSSEYNLVVAPQSTTSARSLLGADVTAGFNAGKETPIDFGLRLGWAHEFADTARPMTAAFASAPGSRFTVYGATMPRDSALIGLSLTARISRNASLFASYDGEFSSGSRNNQLWGGLRVTW